jgi:hypothetical protein
MRPVLLQASFVYLYIVVKLSTPCLTSFETPAQKASDGEIHPVFVLLGSHASKSFSGEQVAGS